MASCDLLITGARVIDGSGAVSQFIDVVIDRDRIVDLGDCGHWQADTDLDAAGLVLAPGFIDSHTHDDLAVLKTPDIPFKISQGVTTVVAGNCGISLAPLQSANNMPAPFPLLGGKERVLFSISISLSRCPGPIAQCNQPGTACRS